MQPQISIAKVDCHSLRKKLTIKIIYKLKIRENSFKKVISSLSTYNNKCNKLNWENKNKDN